MFFSALFSSIAQLLGESPLLLSHISDRTSFPRALSPEEEQSAIARLSAGDEDAARTLIEHNLRLSAHIARKYASCGIDRDDLVSIGSIGLIKAVRSYRPESGRLATYAARCIENEILMAIRSNRKTRGDLSLNVPIGADREGNEITLQDILSSDEDGVPETVALRIDAGRALSLLSSVLDSREKTVIVMRYGLTDGKLYSQSDIAALLGISRSYVSRIEKKALTKLRKKLDHA